MFHWTMHLKGPPEIQHAIIAVGHKLYFFGQEVGQTKIDVKVFDTVSLRWMKSPPLTPGRGGHLEIPSRCRGYTAVLIGYIAYIWGGIPYCNTLYAFDVDAHTWFKPRVSGTVPEVRWGHSACVLGMGMYIYGGCIQPYKYFNDMYRLDTTTMVWYLINTRGTPPSRSCSQDHTATIIGTKIFVFGGTGLSDDYPGKTINVFDTETNSWLTTPIGLSYIRPSKSRAHHAGFAYNGELYIFGGYNLYNHKPVNDMWKFSPESFSWKRVEPKGKVLFRVHKLFSCMVGDRVICTGEAGKHELYVLDLSPSLKMLCKLAVIQYGLDQSELPHNIRWELAAFPTAEEYPQRETNKNDES